MLNNQQLNITSNNNSKENIRKYLNTSRNSALNIFALVRSSENIPINYFEDKETKQIEPESDAKISLKETLKTMIDFSLFVDPVFMYFALSNFLTSLGFNAPYIYIVDQATKSFGIDPEKADILLSSIGISNMVGRIVIGYLAGLKKMNRVYFLLFLISITSANSLRS